MTDYTIVLQVIISNINEAAVYFCLAIISGVLVFCSCLLGQWLSAKLSPQYPTIPGMPRPPQNHSKIKIKIFPTKRTQWIPDTLDHTYTQCKGVHCCTSTKCTKDFCKAPEDAWCLKETNCCDSPGICSKDNDMAESLSGVDEDYQYSTCYNAFQHEADTLAVEQPQWRFYRLSDGKRETLV